MHIDENARRRKGRAIGETHTNATKPMAQGAQLANLRHNKSEHASLYEHICTNKMKHKAFAFFQKINDMLVTPSYPTGHV
jgi:hypothetical protein